MTLYITLHSLIPWPPHLLFLFSAVIIPYRLRKSPLEMTRQRPGIRNATAGTLPNSVQPRRLAISSLTLKRQLNILTLRQSFKLQICCPYLADTETSHPPKSILFGLRRSRRHHQPASPPSNSLGGLSMSITGVTKPPIAFYHPNIRSTFRLTSALATHS